ncbi:MAG: TonB-dependent receptor plug domain-containing protein [Neptuniibacter sp.]
MALYSQTSKISRLILTSLGLLTSLSVSANETELLGFTEEDIFMDIPQVLSATYLPQKLTETPASVTIIDKGMIEASGFLKFSDLFRLVPGMQAYDVHTNKHGVTYHGMSNDFPNKLEVMINGRSVYIPLLSTVAWETLGISVRDIDYIEVIRGSNVPTQGSNAFLGSINIVTHSPVENQASTITATHGALHTTDYEFKHASRNDLMHYSLHAGYQENEGIDRYSDAGLNQYINFYSTFTPNLTNSFELEMGYSNGHSSRGDGDKEFATDADFVERKHQSNYQMLKWNKLQSDQRELNLTYYHNYLKLTTPTYSDDEIQLLLEESFGPLPAGMGTLTNFLNPLGIYKDNEHGETDLHDLELLYKSKIGFNSSFILGLGYRYQRAKSAALLANDKEWTDENRYRAFGNLEHKLGDNWTFNLGAMYENSDISVDAFSPRIAANYLIDPTSTIRAAVTKAHRLPSILEVNGSGTIVLPYVPTNIVDVITTPNFDLNHEEIESFEIGYVKLWPSTKAMFDLRLFYEDVQGAIDTQFIVDTRDTVPGKSFNIARTNANNAQWVNKGFEVQAKTPLPTSFPSSLTFNYGYTNPSGFRNRGQLQLAAPTEAIDSLDARAPLHTASLLLSSEPWENYLLGVAYYYIDHTEWLEGYSKNSPRNQYTRADLTLRKNIQLDNDNQIQVSLLVQNLFDTRYSEFYRYNDFDRRAYLQLKLTY